MTLQALSAATVLLLASSVAFASEPVKTEPPKAKEAATTSTSTSTGGSANGSQQSAGPSRSRAEVHAEAVEAARKHRATLSESLDFLKN